MSFTFDPTPFRLVPKKKPQVETAGLPPAPDAPTLEAPPQRDMAGESRQRLNAGLIAAAVAALLSPRRAAGAVTSFLRGGQAGADAKYADKVADVERTNRTAMTQFGANQARFGNDLRLDETGYRRGRDSVGDAWRERAWDRQGEQIAYGRGRDSVGDAWRERAWDRQGEQIAYGRGRDAVGDDRWRQDFQMRGDQVARRNMEADRNWGRVMSLDERTKGLDERNQALQGLGALSQYTRLVAPFDDKSQAPLLQATAPLLQRLGVTAPTGPLTLAPKPVDPYKMGMLQLQRDKLGQLKIWQSIQAGQGAAKIGISAANLNMRGQELGLKQSLAQFDQELKAAQMSGLTPEQAMNFSLRARGLANAKNIDPSDRESFIQMGNEFARMAGMPGGAGAIGSIAEGLQPSVPPVQVIVPPRPTVGQPSRQMPPTVRTQSGAIIDNTGGRPAVKPLVKPGTVGGPNRSAVPKVTPKASPKKDVKKMSDAELLKMMGGG